MLFKLPAGGMGFVLDVGGPVRVTDLGNRVWRNPQKYWVAYGTKKTSVSLSDPHLTFYLTHGSDILSSILSKNSIWHSLWQVFWHYMHTLHYITLHYIIIITLYYITLHTYIYIYILLEERKKKALLELLANSDTQRIFEQQIWPNKKR